MAWYVGLDSHVYYTPQRGESHRKRMANQPLEVLHGRVPRFIRFLLPARTSYARPQLLQRPHVACAEECRGR